MCFLLICAHFDFLNRWVYFSQKCFYFYKVYFMTINKSTSQDGRNLQLVLYDLQNFQFHFYMQISGPFGLILRGISYKRISLFYHSLLQLHEDLRVGAVLHTKHIQENNFQGQSHSTSGKAFALQIVDLCSIMAPHMVPQTLPGVCSKDRVKSNPEHR